MATSSVPHPAPVSPRMADQGRVAAAPAGSGRKRRRRKDHKRRVSKSSVVDMGSVSSAVYDLTSMPGATPLSKYWLSGPQGAAAQEPSGQMPYRIDSNGNPLLLLPFVRPDYGSGPAGGVGNKKKMGGRGGGGADRPGRTDKRGGDHGGIPLKVSSDWWDPALSVSRFVDESNGPDSEVGRTAYR